VKATVDSGREDKKEEGLGLIEPRTKSTGAISNVVKTPAAIDAGITLEASFVFTRGGYAYEKALKKASPRALRAMSEAKTEGLRQFLEFARARLALRKAPSSSTRSICPSRLRDQGTIYLVVDFFSLLPILTSLRKKWF
jgi:hypothetical protein